MPKELRSRMNREQRRQSILQAATSLVAQYGYWGLTLRDVAREAHITETGVLYHFKDKERLLLAIVEYNDDIVGRAIGQQLGVIGDIDYRLGIAVQHPITMRDLSIATASVNKNRPEFVRLYTMLQAESLATDHPAHEFFADRERRVLNEYAIACERDDVDNPQAVAREVLSAMDGLQIRWLHNIESMDFLKEWTRFINRLIPLKN
ncbi:TetR/AcrR family transcriptional regulator [Bifidobacterium felsineum]|uniref:TetR family transcriptional regulator n=1 Tax=Bifidobacterium felsineum TaxID=2045440 RepID=A0A2M9HM19_9BIFI|nr:TetR/AcrR family transcriptional regulator [Bifidobacterium felsineum]PJM77854.1 TetR family transcriptional regulator [Bifidobacterium felsineum]